MKPTQPEILAYVLKTVQDLCQDWDYEIGRASCRERV